jgi:hypothetical protein
VLAAQKLGNVPANLRALMGQGKPADELGAGITSGFAVVSIRGKAWRIKHRGEERTLMRDDGDGPRASIDVVIVKAAPQIAKIWYQSGYVEGSTSPPDCWSVDGIKPDPASPKLQNPTCGGCPQNAWGSAVRPGGSGKGKACADSKRLAIVPEGDMSNEMYGGPMLLRVPPASLGAVKAYADSLNSIGYAPYGVVTRLKFDPTTEYPAISFEPVRAVTEEEAAIIIGHRQSPTVDRILNTAIDHVETDGEDTSHTGPTPPLQVAPVRQSAPVQPVQAPPAQAQPVQEAKVDDRRSAMRKLGLSEDQITAAIGPEPKPTPEPEPAPVDPRIASMRALGLTDEQINAALGLTPRGSDHPQPETGAKGVDAQKQTEPARRGRKPKETPKEATPEPQATTEAAPEEDKPLDAKADEPAASDLPEGFEDALAAMLGPSQTH